MEKPKRGQQLWVKSPPYYKKEYLYEISSAGEKQIRANLYHSPKVKKSWSSQEFQILLEMGIIRIVDQV